MIIDGIVRGLSGRKATVEILAEAGPSCGADGCSAPPAGGRTVDVANTLHAHPGDCVTIEESGMARLGRPLLLFGAPLALAVAGAAALGGNDARTGLGLVLGLGVGVGLALWLSRLLARRHLYEPHMVRLVHSAASSCCSGNGEGR